MDTITRAKNICLTPKTEWPIIAEEQTPTGALISGYVAPLAAIGAIAGLIGGSLVGITLPFAGTYRVPITTGIVSAIFAFVMAIVGVFILSLIISALAPTFDGQKNSAQALKVAVYSYTPAWLAGVLHILPLLGTLSIIAAFYGLYLLYLGLPRLMKCPEDKAAVYTGVIVVCAIVLAVAIGAVGAAVVGAGMMAGGGIASTRSSGEVAFDKDSALGKLQALGDKLDASNKKAEAAEKSGDHAAAATAAAEGLATLFGGGRRVDPVGVEQLKPFVPDTFAGLAKRSSRAEKNGIAGLMVSKAEAEYGDGADKRVTLEISDSGGASGLMSLAGWANVEDEKDNESVTESTHKVDGRLVHERQSKTGGTNEFAVVLGDRFVVGASGSGVGLNELKSAVGRLELAKLESMKDVGVRK
jgi:hypothetical protein